MRGIADLRRARLAVEARLRKARERYFATYDLGAYCDDVAAARTAYAHERRRFQESDEAKASWSGKQ
jgi:hypothetical protein